MFEKEAEERITEQFGTSGEYITRQRIWQDGATFGYNKAKEEMQEQGLALQSDMDKTIEQNIALKKQIEKLKCCRNCKKLDNRKVECSEGSDLIYFFGKNCDKWEIKE